MRRRLFNCLAGISLLMLGIVVLFWVRSYLWGDYLSWYDKPKLFDAHSSGGLFQLSAGTLVSDRYPRRLGWEGSFWPFDRWGDYYEVDLKPGTTLGFRIEHWQMNRNGDRGNALNLVAPYWSLATLFAILPLLVLRRWIRNRNRNPFACLTCGYDLRATPERCPECGAVSIQKLS